MEALLTMTSMKMLFQEIRYRKINFAMGLLAVTVASTLFVAGPTLIEGYGEKTRQELDAMADETRKLMRDMGFNLMIVHKDTNMADFWASDFSTVDMPEEYVNKLASDRTLTLVTHLVATLQQKIEWNHRKVLLVGYLPETTQLHARKKSPMGYNVKSGTVLLGHELGVGHGEGETIEVLGKKLTIAGILPEKGSKEDITIAMHLTDAQEILNRPGKINQILALGCRCAGERLPKIRAQLGQTLPDTKITEFRSIALARAEQRDLVRDQAVKIISFMETLASVTTPLVVLACGVWVGLLAMSNVRERKTEIGLLRALGVGSGKVALLFLGRAVLLGFLGGGIGFVFGTGLARQLGQLEGLAVSAEFFQPAYSILLMTLLGAPALSALASYLPTLLAVLQDPAVVLRDQ